jgi:Carboxypeptidase regulatory-like domain/TonB dependent receptor
MSLRPIRALLQSVLVVASVIVPATAVSAQTTGRIVGQISDTQGAVLPGVTVTVSGPALQGTQVQVTDAQGNYRFMSLPPGRYALKAELSSFKPAEQSNVDVGLDRTATIDLKMQLASLTETVQVQAESPAVDISSTTTGVNVTPELFNKLPVRRDFYGLTTMAPGVTQDNVGPMMYGSSSAENQYIIDGLNTTGVELGDKGKTLNNDFIQEVEVKTGGLPAEYGRMTGGVVNVLTKSGGNQVRGSAFAFGEGGPLQSDNSTASERPQTTTQIQDVAHQADAGVELGGFIVKDRLWYFGAYNRVNERDETTVIRDIESPGAPGIGSVIPLTINRDLYAVKLTARAGASNTFNFNVNGDPTKRDGNVFIISGPPSTFSGQEKTGGTDLVGRYNGVFGSSFLLEGVAARHKEKDNFFGPGRDIVQTIDATVDPNATAGGFGFFQDQEFTRDVVKADVTKYWGAHDIKAGADWEHVSAINNNFNGGAGQRLYKLSTEPDGQGIVFYRHRFYVNDRAPGFVRDDPTTWQIALPLTSKPDTHNISFYARDNWKVREGLTISAGLRWEGQDVRNRDGESAFKLNNNWAPRVGFIWDVAGNNRSKLYANYGRFFESVPMDINIRAFGGEVQCFCYNLDPNPANLIPDPNAPRQSALLGGAEPVDPNLKGQYIDEWLAGFEYQLQGGIVVGTKYVHRNLGRVIEDFLIPSEGNYFIANPGSGIGSEMAFYDQVHTAPAPKPKRVENAFEVTTSKRFSNNFQFISSLVFSKLDGNYDGTFQASTGQLDPNINSAFDYADFLVNADGKLSNDRNVMFKLFGSYEVPGGPVRGLNLGLTTHWYSGLPNNAYGYSFAYNNWEYYLVERGSLGRGPTDWEADLQISYPIRLGADRRLNLIANIFNLFDRQAINQFDQRYNLISSGVCGGIADGLCNGDGGILTTGNSLTPAGVISNPRATATNPDFLIKGPDSQTRGFTGQRSIQLGVRFQF